MKLPRRLARFNSHVTNRIQGVYAWLVPPWTVILHRGRRSGRPYRTPVLAFRIHRVLIVPVLYGEESDWIRNLETGGGHVVRAGRTFAVKPPRVVDSDAASELLELGAVARNYCRLAEKQAILALGEPRPGFGPGRDAGARDGAP
jgi:deazaflavin-dependent oxidoreductase (nitroreductase family)